MEFNLSAVSFVSENNFSPLEEDRVYDVLIIGGGPAGLTAAVYCIRKGLDTGIIVKSIGGQVADTAAIENYMGYKYINGVELVDKFREQVEQFSIGYEEGQGVLDISDGEIKKVKLEDKRTVSARTVIIASGKSWKKLNVPGEERLTGRGVAYCSICDAPLFSGKNVIVVGGGNSGVESAIDLASIASHITVVQITNELTADKILIDKLSAFSNVDYIYNSAVTEILGDQVVSGAVIKNIKDGQTGEMAAEGVFIEIGLDPNSSFAREAVALNEYGEIIVDCSCRTSAAGIFAAGDVTSVPYKQIIIAGGEGAKAALSSWEYLLKLQL